MQILEFFLTMETYFQCHSKKSAFCHFSAKKLNNSSGRFANATLVRLSEFLSTGYKKGVRPVKDWRTSTIVAIDLMVYSILNVVSSAAQTRDWCWVFLVCNTTYMIMGCIDTVRLICCWFSGQRNCSKKLQLVLNLSCDLPAFVHVFH